jgi:DNA-binding NtrC family response regulator
LFYRLQVFDIAIPPLRNRRDDVLPLSEAMLQEIGRSFGRPPASLTPAAREALRRHNWPGNVRELRNALERAAIRCDGSAIDPEHLGLRPAERAMGEGSSDLHNVERGIIVRVLEECRGNKARAARRLGLTRTQLYSRIQKYGLESQGTPSSQE